MSNAYRGGKEQAQALDRAIAALTERLTPIFWERVAPAWTIDADFHPSDADPIGARHVRLEALRDAIHRIEAVEGRPLGKLPSHPDEIDAEEDWDVFMSALVRDVRAMDGDAIFKDRGVRRWGTRMIFEGAAVDVSVVRVDHGKSWHYQVAFRAAVPLGAKLTLRGEGITQDLLEMLGFRSEIELGDQRFDPVFVVGGDEESARALLTPAARSALLDVSATNKMVLDADAGVARLATLLPLPGTLDRAVRALADMHRAPAPHALLRAP